ncbi:M18 family aminopeptidase [Enorma massiliensis]|uniref:M18 family aminopeptidase n=1 Tax=Enorma massiliensis TaxID=1472761 RepID=UPI003A94E59B
MVAEEDVQAAEGLISFIEQCPSMFHTAATISARLEAQGFARLSEGDAWRGRLEPGGRYYAERNGSSIIAFKVGEAAAADPDRFHFQLTAAHGDSPTFKVKATPELEGPEGSLRLNVEAYGGMIDYTWFDRPLSVAGRVLVRTATAEGERVESRLIAPDRDIALIPSLAIHLDRSMNDGFSPNRATDLCPLVSAGELGAGSFDELVAAEAGVEPEQVLARDLFLVNREPARVWGAAHEFVSSPKLDDLMCAYTSLLAFLAAENPGCVTVFCCFDNEEVGSNTKQGAMSTFLPDVLGRLTEALGLTPEDYRRALAKSMLVSCDNAHAVHPNRPEKYDAANRCCLNGGIVVKEAANQHYCTDAFSRAAFLALCERAGVPCQTFANRSDMAGGSTLGNLSNIQASMHAVDVGCPQLAMHSSYETAGTRDVRLATRALQAFFEASMAIEGAESVRFC